MNDRATERLLKLAEVEQRIGMSRASLYRMMRDGSLRSVKVRGARRVPESAVAEFIAALGSDSKKD